ncbi:MAG: hypothetical protein ACR2HM_06695 [Acidimicrobiales bacterium]
MKDISLVAAVAVIILGSVTLGVGGLALLRRGGRGQVPQHNDFIGMIFAQVALLYSVLLAFMVFSTWQRFTDSASSVSDEAAAVVVAYRDTEIFPEPIRSEAQAALRSYLKEVMENEWASHGAVRPHRSRDALNPVWAVYRQYQPTEGPAQSDFDAAKDRLHEVEAQRHARHLAGETSLPNVFWWLLVGGGIVTVAMSYMFWVERRSIHLLQVGVLTAAIACVLSLILALNFPFTGDVHVSRDPFKHALLNFDAIDIRPGPPAPGGASTVTETVTVDAKRSFTDTGVDVAAGDRVTIGATGIIFHDSSGSTGPNGVAERRDLSQFNVIESDNHAALIGRIGETGSPFAVGTDFSSASLAPGRLFLGVNDVGVDNNSGAFSATVTVRRT